MDSYLYTCDYCHIEYEPKKRGKQRFCSTSCRVRWHQVNKKAQSKLAAAENTVVSEVPVEENPKNNEETKRKTKVDKMSVAGVGNAAAGSILAQKVTEFFTKEEDKPATKGDILKVIQYNERYQVIENLPPNEFGQFPYFDLETRMIIYGGLINPFKNEP